MNFTCFFIHLGNRKIINISCYLLIKNNLTKKSMNTLKFNIFKRKNILFSHGNLKAQKLFNLSLKNFCAGGNYAHAEIQKEIKISPKEISYFFPIKGLPKFENGLYTVFNYKEEPVKKDEEGVYQRLPQVPYEIKEHAFKGTIYTFFLVCFGRFYQFFYQLLKLHFHDISVYSSRSFSLSIFLAFVLYVQLHSCYQIKRGWP